MDGWIYKDLVLVIMRAEHAHVHFQTKPINQLHLHGL